MYIESYLPSRCVIFILVRGLGVVYINEGEAFVSQSYVKWRRFVCLF